MNYLMTKLFVEQPGYTGPVKNCKEKLVCNTSTASSAGGGFNDFVV